MARTLINGTSQIQAGTIPWAAMASGAIVPTASLVDGANFLKKDGTVTMTGSLNAGGYTIQGVGSPQNATDAANRQYVDLKAGGIGGIHTVRVLAASNVTVASPGSAFDGVAMAAGDIALLIGQTTASQNGPWVWNGAATSMSRPTWWAAGSTVNAGQYFIIDDGVTYKDTKFFCATVGTITVDTTSVSFTQDQSGVNYSAGASSGLTLTGTAFSVNTGNGITITSNNVTAVGNGSSLIGVSGSGIGILNSTSAGQVIVGNASNVPTWTTVGGDASLSSAGSLSLNTVNSNTGSFGAGNAIPYFTVNAKGLITAAGTTSIAAPAGALTGTALAANVVSSSITSVGTLTSLSVSGASSHGGVATFSVAPVMTGLTGFLYGNGSSAISASTGIPSTALSMSFNEIPLGLLNGSNTAFTLAHTPVNNSLQVLMNGVTLRPGASYDYTVSGGTITMNYAPSGTDYLSASYFW